MIIVWISIYVYVKKQLMAEFNLDSDLTKHSGAKSSSVVETTVQKAFDHHQRKLLQTIEDEEAEVIQKINSQKF